MPINFKESEKCEINSHAQKNDVCQSEQKSSSPPPIPTYPPEHQKSIDKTEQNILSSFFSSIKDKKTIGLIFLGFLYVVFHNKFGIQIKMIFNLCISLGILCLFILLYIIMY